MEAQVGDIHEYTAYVTLLAEGQEPATRIQRTKAKMTGRMPTTARCCVDRMMFSVSKNANIVRRRVPDTLHSSHHACLNLSRGARSRAEHAVCKNSC
jgi:hypothetical protein